jgi:type IV pilus biogenesis protein PilP
MTPRLTLLLAVCSALSYLSFKDMDSAVPGPDGLPRDGRSAHAAIAPPPEPSTGPWQEQIDRPLFTASRRPPEVEVADPVPEAEPDPPPPAAASGIVLRDGHALALLRLADGQFVRVAAGDHIEGWQVVRITRDGVELTRGDRAVTLNARVPMADGLIRAN